eukprot:s3143_g3.t1
MARTDARATLGLDEAIDRCLAFVEAGADITFLEAPRSEEEMKRYCQEVPGYKMVNMLPSGKTPFLSLGSDEPRSHQRLHDLGFAIAAYPLTLLSAGLKAQEAALQSLKQKGQVEAGLELNFDKLKDIVEHLMKISSPGLAFKVDADELEDFLQDDAFREVEEILKASHTADPEEILRRLEGPEISSESSGGSESLRHTHVVRISAANSQPERQQMAPGSSSSFREDCRTVKHTGLGTFRWFASNKKNGWHSAAKVRIVDHLAAMTSSSSSDSSEEEKKKAEENGSDSDSDSGSSESSSEKKKKKKAKKEKKKKKKDKKDKKSKKNKKAEKKGKKKKDKKKKKKKGDDLTEAMRGSVSNQFGKYGIIKAEDFFSKKPEFMLWAQEVRKVNTDILGQMQLKDLFKEYVEDYNTATMPSKKYYNIQVFEQQMSNKRRKKKAETVIDTALQSSLASFDDEKADAKAENSGYGLACKFLDFPDTSLPEAVDAVESTGSTGSTLTVSKNITQMVHVCAEHKKFRKLARFMDKIRQKEKEERVRQKALVIIFCNKIQTLKSVSGFLRKHKHHCEALHSGIPQAKRENALNMFKAGQMQVLVATDVAARGLHVKHLRYVVNYDFPSNLEQYCHRIGRTGRDGEAGTAYSFFTRNLAPLSRDLVQLLERSDQEVDPNLRALAEGKVQQPGEKSSAEEEASEEVVDEASADEAPPMGPSGGGLRITPRKRGGVEDESSEEVSEGPSGVPVAPKAPKSGPKKAQKKVKRRRKGGAKKR